ncbi:hypothetical protein [Mesorhizobium sp. M1A.F.Ca.ET.072.01.1.1]|nr:hypothetical protein [Mesorhizobium sp. M1A.F.Ca.ET.072.01.1.1]
MALVDRFCFGDIDRLFREDKEDEEFEDDGRCAPSNLSASAGAR